MLTNAKMVVRAWTLLALVATAAHASSVDRSYQFGDNIDEIGFAGEGNSVNSNFGPVTLDGTPNGPLLNAGFHDLEYLGATSPKYTSTSATGRPGATAPQWGLKFNGTSDLVARNSTAPGAANGGLGVPGFFDSDPQYASTVNYDNITNRLMGGWVRPTNAAAAGQQDIVWDTQQFGIFISAPVSGVRYWGFTNGDPNPADDDVIVVSTTPVVFNDWTHVMHRTFGNGDAVLYVDGIGVAWTTNNYDTTPDATDINNLVFGASVDKATNFFAGDLDEWEFRIAGNNSNLAGPPAGQNWGDVNLATDNDAIRQALIGKPLGDANLDGSTDAADITHFVNNYGTTRSIGGFVFGDLTSRGNGDFDFDGDIDLNDALILRNGLIAAGSGAAFDLSGLGNVPEPGSLVLAALALVGVFGARRRS